MQGGQRERARDRRAVFASTPAVDDGSHVVPSSMSRHAAIAQGDRPAEASTLAPSP